MSKEKVGRRDQKAILAKQEARFLQSLVVRHHQRELSILIDPHRRVLWLKDRLIKLTSATSRSTNAKPKESDNSKHSFKNTNYKNTNEALAAEINALAGTIRL